MITLIIIFVMLAIVLAIALAVSICSDSCNINDNKIDNEYLTEEGDHKYYDRSLIKKKDYIRNNPGIKDIRKLKRLFSQK